MIYLIDPGSDSEISAQLGGFYRKLSVYGHMGHRELEVPWENTALASKLK